MNKLFVGISFLFIYLIHIKLLTMSFSINTKDIFTTISFSTEKLDAIVSPDLKSELVILNKNGVNNILVDLSSVKYCDSSGLSALLIGNRMCTESKGKFVLSSLQPSVQKLIVISQLDSILNIETTIEKATDIFFEANI